MPVPKAAKCHEMTAYYKKLYTDKFNRVPVYNANAARWGFDGMLRNMPESEVKALIAYYLTLDPIETKHFDLTWFLYNYEKVQTSMAETLKDREAKARLLKESRERTEKWLQREQSRTIGN